jgi:hypothetical protein
LLLQNRPLKKLIVVLYFALFNLYPSFGQADSCNLRITLLTCGPGEDLYSRWGHTALRVQEQSTGTDNVFNYGTFEFNPDFYMKFIRGKLLYFLSVQSFEDFMYQYKVESRSVQEQELQLSCQEKQRLLNALLVNAEDENRYYRYDFLFDNCTTRAGDIVAKNTNSPVVFKNVLPANPPSFRDLIHEYLDAGHQYWSKLGIDILLGAKLDRRAGNKQAIYFLPDYLLKGFDRALVNGHRLAAPPRTILSMPSPPGDKSFFTPFIVFSLVFLVVVLLSFSSNKRVRAALNIFDFLFFFLLGLAGILLLFMWFGTDHKVCQNNYNLLWALPTNAVMAFFIGSRKQWVKKYFLMVSLISILLAICWFFLPQQMNNALIPVLLLIIFRSWYLSKQNNYAGKAGQG